MQSLIRQEYKNKHFVAPEVGNVKARSVRRPLQGKQRRNGEEETDPELRSYWVADEDTIAWSHRAAKLLA